MTIVGTTVSSKEALDRLRSIKPNDGWSIQKKENSSSSNDKPSEIRLLRRNVPLTDHFFVDLHYHAPTHTIVGLLTKDATECQILVDGTTGRPVPPREGVGTVSCANSYGGYQPLTRDEIQASSNSQQVGSQSSSFFDNIPSLESFVSGSTSNSNNSRGGNGNVSSLRNSGSSSNNNNSMRRNPASQRVNNNTRNNNNNPNNNGNPFADLSEEDRQLYKKYATVAIGCWIGYQILKSMLGELILLFLIVPGVYAYGAQTCPSNESFDAKKEVKRVLRGYHLPENHPQKPRRGNFLEEWTAKIGASVATELSAAAGGYSLEIAPLLGGCAKHATVTLPTLDLTCEWIGFNDTWYHYRTYTREQ